MIQVQVGFFFRFLHGDLQQTAEILIRIFELAV